MPYRTLAKIDGLEVVREYSPTKRTITIGNGRQFLLQFPYVIFLRMNGILFVAFSLKPIKSLNDKVYCASLGNIYPYWNVCGCGADDINTAIQIFWESRFTQDGGAGPHSLAAIFGTYREWQQLKSLRTITTKIRQLSKDVKTFEEFLQAPAHTNGYSSNRDKDRYKFTLDSEYPQTSSVRQLRAKMRKKAKEQKKQKEATIEAEAYDDYDYDDDWYDDDGF